MKQVSEIENKIAMLVEEVTYGKVKAADVLPTHKLISDLKLDSLDYAQTMLGCEEWLKAKVNEAEVDWRQVQTVHDLATILCRSQK